VKLVHLVGFIIKKFTERHHDIVQTEWPRVEVKLPDAVKKCNKVTNSRKCEEFIDQPETVSLLNNESTL